NNSAPLLCLLRGEVLLLGHRQHQHRQLQTVNRNCRKTRAPIICSCQRERETTTLSSALQLQLSTILPAFSVKHRPNLQDRTHAPSSFARKAHNPITADKMASAGQDSAAAAAEYPRVGADFKSELESFRPETLTKADTQEKNPLPTAEDVQSERAQRSVFEGIESFDASQLKHAETCEKNPLPDQEAIKAEKGVQHFIECIESFDTSRLKHAETLEKNPLPTREIIEEEKRA
uniref:Thymosin beta n=2 Tax=Anopheles albimanus TaxID=7167 RepID=A0A182FJ19_ANOAL